MVPRMRTINKAIDYFKKADENTSITFFMIKRLCEEGKVKCFKTGTRVLVNLDDLLEKLTN